MGVCPAVLIPLPPSPARLGNVLEQKQHSWGQTPRRTSFLPLSCQDSASYPATDAVDIKPHESPYAYKMRAWRRHEDAPSIEVVSWESEAVKPKIEALNLKSEAVNLENEAVNLSNGVRGSGCGGVTRKHFSKETISSFCQRSIMLLSPFDGGEKYIKKIRRRCQLAVGAKAG